MNKRYVWHPVNLESQSSPGAILEYLELPFSKRMKAWEVNLRVKKHLAFLGWKIESRSAESGPRVRYTSPHGEVYVSLNEVCCNLSKESGGEVRTLQQYVSFYDDGGKSSNPEIKKKAKEILYTCGWQMNERITAKKKTLIYQAPGKKFFSLKKACEWYLEQNEAVGDTHVELRPSPTPPAQPTALQPSQLTPPAPSSQLTPPAPPSMDQTKTLLSIHPQGPVAAQKYTSRKRVVPCSSEPEFPSKKQQKGLEHFQQLFNKDKFKWLEETHADELGPLTKVLQGMLLTWEKTKEMAVASGMLESAEKELSHYKEKLTELKKDMDLMEDDDFAAIKEKFAKDLRERENVQNEVIENLKKEHVSAIADAKTLGVAEWRQTEEFRKAAIGYAEQNMAEVARWVFENKVGTEILCREGEKSFSSGKQAEQEYLYDILKKNGQFSKFERYLPGEVQVKKND